MKKQIIRLGLLLLVAAIAGALLSRPAVAGAVTFTVTVKSAYLRSSPALQAARVQSIFKGQTYTLLGRTADSTWVRLDFAGAATETWCPVAYGTVKGDLNSLPISGAGGSQPQPTAPAAPGQAVPADSTPVPPTPTLSALRLPSNVILVPNGHFYVTAKSVYLRTAPNANADKLGALFSGQTLPVAGRSFDALWVEVVSDGAPAWIVTSAGKLSYPIGMLPITDQANVVTPATPGWAPPPRSSDVNLKPEWLPTISSLARQYYLSYRFGKSLNMFTVAGDCNSDDATYLARVSAGTFDLTGYPELNDTVGWFAPSFSRRSLATHGGLSAATMFDAAWAHPTLCHKGVGRTEGPYPCELRDSQASIVFLAVGTGDHFNWKTFEASYQHMIVYALQNQVLPVLVTKADEVESQVDGAPEGYINSIIRKLADKYQVPLMDFWQATRDLPNHGLRDENPPFHLSQAGFDMRTLYMLKVLDLIWH